MRSRKSATESGVGGGGNDSRRSSSDHPGSQSQDASWQCPTCTYSNLFSLYSCEICSTKKPSSRGVRGASGGTGSGLSSRSSLQNQQDNSTSSLVSASLEDHNGSSTATTSTANAVARSRSTSPDSMLQNAMRKRRKTRLKISDMVDFKVFTTTEITVGDKTVVITDFKLKKLVLDQQQQHLRHQNSLDSTSSYHGNNSVSSDLNNSSVFIKEESNQSSFDFDGSNSISGSNSAISPL
ncbi:uncharacterized protein LOC142353031 [Convolutriloba macropyga]|uniref:uncharacterized protein LOC142353031 n=1 Tax=Convolutriloba macropyga TaxID=536237 RepID=UPI003F526F6C